MIQPIVNIPYAKTHNISMHNPNFPTGEETKKKNTPADPSNHSQSISQEEKKKIANKKR